MRKLRDLLRRRSGTVAFVLSGGGNLGAIQVGMLRALAEHEIRPDVVLGTSVGAMNGAAYAQAPSLPGIARMEELWRSLDGRDVMPSGWLPGAVALARRGEALHGSEGVRKVIEGILGVARFEDLELAFQCVATDVAAAREHWFAEGALVEPILASAAIPGVYPAVEIDGVRYLDGAIVNDIPVSRAVELGARTIYVLHCGSFDRPRPDPKRPVDVIVQAYWIARHHRFKRDIASLPPGVDAVVLPTGQPPLMRFNDFTRSGELIAAAHLASAQFLGHRVDGDSERTVIDADASAPGRVLAAAGEEPDRP
jgi:NTE family protein